jgi:O-antigen/teichoic acid export membrane protein
MAQFTQEQIERPDSPNRTTIGQPQSRYPSGIRSVLSNWSAFLFCSVVAFFVSPFVVRHLGDSGYGIWTLTLSVTGYLGLLDLGVRGAVTRYVAKFHAQGVDESASRVVSSGLTIFLGAGALAIVFSSAIALFVVGSLKIPESYQFIAKVVVILTGVNIAVSLISGVFGGVVTALQRFDLSNSLEIVSTALRTSAIVLVLSHGRGLISLALVQLSFGILTGLAYSVMAFRLYPGLTIRLSSLDKANMKLIFSFSSYAFLLQASSYLIFYSDSVVIGVFLPVSAVTFFAIAGNLLSYSRGLLGGMSTVSSPMASALEARGSMDELRRVLLKGARFGSMVFLPIGVCFLIRGRSFIGLWMGPSYAGLAGKVLVILTVAQLVAAGNFVPGSVTLGIGRHKGIVPAVLIEGLCNLGLSIGLVHSYGIAGVAVGTALPNLVTHLFFWPWYIRRVYGIRPITYALSTWVRPALAAIPFALCTYAIQKWWPATNLFVFSIQTAFALPVVLVSFWFLCVGRQERAEYFQRFLVPLLRIYGRSYAQSNSGVEL